MTYDEMLQRRSAITEKLWDELKQFYADTGCTMTIEAFFEAEEHSDGPTTYHPNLSVCVQSYKRTWDE